jgi:microcystin-dependent protein
MTADTYSAILGFLDQGTGNNNNTWGDNCDISVFAILEKAICGYTTRAITGGTTDLSGTPPPAGPTQPLEYIQNLTGALGSDHTIIVPNLAKTWVFRNNTSGAFGVLIKTTSGTAVCVPQGTTKLIFCDGNNICRRLDQDSVGEIFWYGGTTVPNGAAECDGSTISRAGLGIDLFAKIGTTWGVGNGSTTFTLPDGKTAGKFLRSRTGAVTVGTSQADQNQSHTHTLTAVTVNAGGDHNHGGATGAGGAHTHTINDPGHTHVIHHDLAINKLGNSGGSPIATINVSQGTTDGGTDSATTGITINAAVDHTHSIASSGTHTHTISGSTDTSGSSEARPTNLSVMMCIRL